MLSFASLNQLRSCSSISVAMEKGYIIFSHEKRTKSRKMSPKTQVTADRLVQMFRVSHTADYYNWADVFQVFSWGMHVTTMEELERLMMRNSNVNYFDYFPVSCDGVGSVGMHQLNYNNLQYDLLEIFVPISPLPPAFFSSSFYSSFSFSWEKKCNLPLLQQDGSWFKEAISRIRNILLAWNLAGVFVHFITSFNLPDSGL